MRTKFLYVMAVAAAVSGCDLGSVEIDSKDPFQCSLAFSMEWINLTQGGKADKAAIARAAALRDKSEQHIAQLDESAAYITQKAKNASKALLDNEEMTLEEQKAFYEECAKEFPIKAAPSDINGGFAK